MRSCQCVSVITLKDGKDNKISRVGCRLAGCKLKVDDMFKDKTRFIPIKERELATGVLLYPFAECLLSGEHLFCCSQMLIAILLSTHGLNTKLALSIVYTIEFGS